MTLDETPLKCQKIDENHEPTVELQNKVDAQLGGVHLWRQMIFSLFWPPFPPSSDVVLVTT